MATPQFFDSAGNPTKDTEKLLKWIEAQFIEADSGRDVESLNNQAGYIKDFYANVYKLRTLTPERWVKDFANSRALRAWEAMEYTESQMQEQQDNAEARDKVTVLETELAKIKAELARLVEAQQPKPKPKNKITPAKHTTYPEDEEPDTDDEPDEGEDEGA